MNWKHQIALESIKHTITSFQNDVNEKKAKTADFYLMTMIIVDEISNYQDVNFINQNEHDAIFYEFIRAIKNFGESKIFDFDYKVIDQFIENKREG